MPIEVGIWRLGDDLQEVTFGSIDSEAKLEETLAKEISILSPKLMLIGRQIPTAYTKFIDMLAIDIEGNLSVIALKRDQTAREVVAQVLDYASWVENLSYDHIAGIYADKNGGQELEKGFTEAFDANTPEKLNQNHELIIVASDLDPSTEPVLGHLEQESRRSAVV